MTPSPLVVNFPEYGAEPWEAYWAAPEPGDPEAERRPTKGELAEERRRGWLP